jgi:hypothetical protein
MPSSNPKSSSSSLIYFGLGLIVVTSAAIAYWAISGDEPLGRLGLWQSLDFQ